MICYLLHFSRPHKHARHYLGTAHDLDARLARHRAGTGARLLQVCNEEGIDYQVVRTWDGGRQVEVRLKARKDAPRLCPVCNPNALRFAVTL